MEAAKLASTGKQVERGNSLAAIASLPFCNFAHLQPAPLCVLPQVSTSRVFLQEHSGDREYAITRRAVEQRLANL